MSSPRHAAALVASFLTVASVVVLVRMQYVYGVEAVSGPTVDLFGYLAIPLLLGLVAAVLGGRRSLVPVAMLVVLGTAVFALPISGSMGESRAAELLEADDSDFVCNTASTGLSVPFDVDRAFGAVDHPADHWLKGPVSGNDLGCSAELEGGADEAFGAWRASLLRSGWRVERDDSEVVVVEGGARLTLFVVGERAYLNASTEHADVRVDGRCTTYDESTDSVAIASWAC